MDKYLYKFIHYWLKKAKVPFMHYSLFNNQPTDLTNSHPYPAIYLQILPIEWNYNPNRIAESVVTVRLHIVNEMYSSTDVRDKDIDKSLEHLDFLKKVYQALDSKSNDDDNQEVLFDDDSYYKVGTFDRLRTQHIQKIKARFYTQIDFQFAVQDRSAWRYNNFVDFTLDGLTGATNLSSGNTWTIEGSF